MRMTKLLGRLTLGGLAAFALSQLVPYGRDHENPPVTKSVTWPDDGTKQLARRACMDCHSNETTWPWYSNVAPISWLVYRDVKTGRRHVNLSEWDKDQDGSDNTAEMIRKGKMPFLPYLFLHSEARLSDADKAQLMKGLEAIQKMGDPGSGGGEAKSKKEGDKD